MKMYQKLLEQYGAPGAQVIDNWWSSESGSPISGIALAAPVGKDHQSKQHHQPLLIRPGSAGKPMPGFDVRTVDDEGNEIKRGQMGNIVMGIPLAPTGLTTLFGDEERFYKGYMKRFDGKWIDTGDAGMIDEDGYVHIMSRSDDIINVAAHRFSTGKPAPFASLSPFPLSPPSQVANPLMTTTPLSGSIEQAIASHPSVAECAVVGIPDALKGHLPFAFITLSTPTHPSSAIPSAILTSELQALVREQIGAIAALGGIVQGKGMIPKTRSGKTLRRVLRELVENAVHGDFEKEVQVPATVEDGAVVEVARRMVREYFRERGGELHMATERRAKL